MSALQLVGAFVLHRPKTSLLQHRFDLSDSLQSATQTGPGQCQQ